MRRGRPSKRTPLSELEYVNLDGSISVFERTKKGFVEKSKLSQSKLIDACTTEENHCFACKHASVYNNASIAEAQENIFQNQTDIVQNQTDIVQNQTDMVHNQINMVHNQTNMVHDQTEVATSESEVNEISSISQSITSDNNICYDEFDVNESTFSCMDFFENPMTFSENVWLYDQDKENYFMNFDILDSKDE